MFASSQIPNKPSETQAAVTWYTLALSSFRSTKASVTSHHPFLPHINPASPPSLCSSVTAAPRHRNCFICLEAFSLWSLFSRLPLTTQVLAQSRLLQWALPGHPIYYYPLLNYSMFLLQFLHGTSWCPIILLLISPFTACLLHLTISPKDQALSRPIQHYSHRPSVVASIKPMLHKHALYGWRKKWTNVTATAQTRTTFCSFIQSFWLLFPELIGQWGIQTHNCNCFARARTMYYDNT